MSDYRKLRLDRRGRVLVAWVHDPPYNFLGNALWEELDRLTREVRRDRSIGAVVFASDVAGSFITHADMPDLVAGTEAAAGPPFPRPLSRLVLRAVYAVNRVPPLRRLFKASPLRGVLTLRQAGDVLRRMNRSDQVYIAAINGTTFGAGFEFVLGCDLRLAAEGDYRVGLIESMFGLYAGTGSGQRLARSIGVAETIELMVGGVALTPHEAHARRLVQRVVPADRLVESALELAERLARRQPQTTGALKRALYDGLEMRRAIGIDQAAYASVVTAPGARAACRAYEREVSALDGSGPFPLEILDRWERGEVVDLVEPKGRS